MYTTERCNKYPTKHNITDFVFIYCWQLKIAITRNNYESTGWEFLAWIKEEIVESLVNYKASSNKTFYAGRPLIKKIDR